MPSHMPRPWVLTAAILLLLSGGGLVAPAVAEHQTSRSLSPENRAEVNRLLREYRAAGSNLEKKKDVCQKVLAIDPAAVPLMLAAVERDLQPQSRKYIAKFQAQAVAAAKRKVGKVDLNQVAEMRSAVHELQKLGDGFTKEVIVEKIDPVVQKLRQAFILERGEVLDKSPELQGERKQLEDLGEMWQRCQAQLPSAPVKENPAKDGSKKSTTLSFESCLQSEEDLAAALAIPLDPRTRAILAMNAKLAEKLDPEEARAILALNLSRNLLGLPALAIDLQLCEAARGHSQDMERLKFFSHESPVPGKKSFTDRAKLAGTTACGENIFAGTSNGNSAHMGWFHSPGHHRNQMGNSSRVGVGRSGTYFTQIFGS